MNKRKIENLLDKLGIPVGTLGYEYWIVAVEIYSKNKFMQSGQLYMEVAEKLNSTPSGVERALRHSYERRKDKIKGFFKVEYAITNRTLLALMARELERIDD